MSERTQAKIDEDYRLACSELGHNHVMSLRLQTQKDEILAKLQALLSETKEAQEKANAAAAESQNKSLHQFDSARSKKKKKAS